MANEENIGQSSQKVPYSQEVSDRLIGALEKGTSVLQFDRAGIDYARSFEGKAYSGVNQLMLQQVRKERGFASPFFITKNRVDELNMQIKKGEMNSARISYWNADHVVNSDYTDRKGVEHKAGEKHPEYEYTPLWNVQQVDPTLLKWEKGNSIPIRVSDALVFNPAPKQENALGIKPGLFYKAKDGSAIERLAEASSKLVNSYLTGAPYQKTTFTKEDVASLREVFAKEPGKAMQILNDGCMVARGEEDKLAQIQANRAQKANSRPAHSM